jgi:hypothetical protein
MGAEGLEVLFSLNTEFTENTEGLVQVAQTLGHEASEEGA